MDVAPDKSGLYIFLGIFVVLIAIAGLIFWKYDTIKKYIGCDAKENEQQPQIIYKEIKLQARDKQNKLIYVDYEVIDNVTLQILQRGTLRENIIEKFRDASQNKTYYFRAFSDRYYSSQESCTLDKETCTVFMEKIADAHITTAILKNDFALGILLVEGGIIIEPILCIRWQNLVNLGINMSQTSIPSNHYNKYDKCYTFNGNLTGGIYQFAISYRLTNEKSSNFELALIDFCNGKYDDGCAPTLSLKTIV